MATSLFVLRTVAFLLTSSFSDMGTQFDNGGACLLQTKKKTGALKMKSLASRNQNTLWNISCGRSVPTRSTSPSVSVCLTQTSDDLPWLRLMLRTGGSKAWNGMFEPHVRNAVSFLKTDPWKLSVSIFKPTDEIAFHDVLNVAANEDHRRSECRVHSVIVRDPVTRLASTYLHSCRTEGLWEQCLSTDNKGPISFKDMVMALEQADMKKISTLFKKQVELCNINRSGHVGIMAQYERPAAAAETVLSSVGLWQEYEAGWGEYGDAMFSELFAGDGVEDKICDLYTPELLRIVQHVYSDDYVAFQGLGYSVHHWSSRCAGDWEAEHSKNEPFAERSAGLVLYEGASDCVPTRTEIERLSKASSRTNANYRIDVLGSGAAEAITFYLHNEGAFNFSAVLNCFLEANGVNLANDNWDAHIYANITEHLGEIWLLKALEKHPQRTMSADTANVHIVAALPFVSYLAASHASCGRRGDHLRRMRAVSQSMEGLPTFKTSQGRNFFVFTTTWRLEAVYTPALLRILERGNVIVGTADKDYVHWNPYPKIRRKVILPYKAHYMVERSAYGASPADALSEDGRKIDFLFRGTMSRRDEGGSRKAIDGLFNKSSHSVDIKNVHFGDKPPHFAEKLAKAYLRSRVCLIPAGDTPTSRRLFDALGAGCVPLALGNFERLANNLPFQRSIHWSKIVLFGGSLQCVSHDGGKTKMWLDSVVSPLNKDRHHSMSSAARDVFRNALSYALNGQSVVTALLRELEHEVGPPRVYS